MAFKIEGKAMYPIFVSAKCCYSIRPSSQASMHTAIIEKPLPHNFCSFMSSLCACPASSAFIKHIFQHTIWYCPTSATGWVQRREKNWSNYRDCTELKRITSRIYSNCLNYSCVLFQVLGSSSLFTLFD